LVRAAEDLGQRRLGVDMMNLAAWDASAAFRRDASADECRELPRLDGDAGKLVVLESACLAPDGSTWDESADPAAVLWPLAEPPLAWAELDKPAAARSAAQSCAVPAAAAAATSGQRVVDLELARSVTELVLPVAQSSMAELAYAPPGELLV
jgi:hypothetical protein